MHRQMERGILESMTKSILHLGETPVRCICFEKGSRLPHVLSFGKSMTWKSRSPTINRWSLVGDVLKRQEVGVVEDHLKHR